MSLWRSLFFMLIIAPVWLSSTCNPSGFEDNDRNYKNLYQKRLPSERVTDQLKSPGFNPPRGTVDYKTLFESCFEKPIVVRKSCPGKKTINNFWFFDADDRECKIFTTDNCNENKNKFSSIESCEDNCLQPILYLEEMQSQKMLNVQNNRNDANGNQFDSMNNKRRRQQNYNRNNRPRSRNQKRV